MGICGARQPEINNCNEQGAFCRRSRRVNSKGIKDPKLRPKKANGTLPHELNTVTLNNNKVILNCLFAAASKTLLTFGNNELNGTLGFLAILHTWDQKLNAHFHLHCLVLGGALSKDKKR